ncbi:MAG: hypothetical protein HC898_06770 [Phycisphaerales bacterium]|nr:hypothetical protein [Phycisphaerales bacterium]
MDLSSGGIFDWQDGHLNLVNNIIIEDGNSTAPFYNGQVLENGQSFGTNGDLTVGDTFIGEFTLGGWNQSEVYGDVFIGRQLGSDGSRLNIGDPFMGYSSTLYVMGDVFVGGDGFTEGGFSDLNIGPYSNFTTDGLLYIHSSSSVSVTDYSYLTAGRILREGSLNLSDAYITLTDTFEVIVDDNYDNNIGADESNPFGSNITISDGGSIRELSVNNFLSVGNNGGTGYLTVQGGGRLIVGNALTFGSGAMVDIDMYGGYYYYGGLIEADDINTFDANPANLRFYNANFQLNTINSLVIDPSAYQFGSEVYVDGSFQREDPNNPGNFIDYNFNYINVPNGQIIVGNTGYGHLVVGNYTQGVETQYMFIGGNAIGADGHVEVSNSNSEYNYNYDNYFYRGIVISNYVNLGAFDTVFTNTLDIDNYGGVWIGGDLTIGSTTSTNATLTGELTQNYYSDLIVGGTFTVNQYGRYRGENFGTLAVGSFNIDPNADFSIFGINLIISNDDLTIAAGELFGDTILVDPSGSNFHAEDPNVTLLTGLELRNGNLNVGASFGKLTVQDPNGYYNYNNSVRIYGTTTVADGAELHILDNGRFSTGSLIVDPNGLFNWEDGYFELTADDLVIDSINGSLPIGDNVIINDYGLTPSRRGLSVSNNHLTVGESGNGELQIFSGYVDAARMTIGGGNGGIGKVTVSGNSYYSTLSINNDDINLGGDEFASFGANSAILTINDYGAVNVYDGVVRIWDNHQIILNGGTLNTQNIIKDDGTGIFTPANFDFISGDLNLTDANVTIDNDNLLGNFVDLVNGKSLNVNSYSIYDPNLGTYVYPNGLTTVKSGATLKVNGGSFTTRRLVIEPGGNFELLGGTFQLSGDDLIIDPITGQLPELVNPGSTSIRVTGGKLIVGDVDFGLMDLSSGTMSSQGAQFGRNVGSTFTVSVGKPDGSVYNSINQYSSGNELVVGGTDTTAGGTGIFTIYKNASVNYDYSNMRIWNGSRVILDGGFLRLNDILKDDGTGTFTHGPTPDFAYNSGNLYLRSNQTLDTGTALGPDLDIDGSKLLEINALADYCR